MKKYNGNILIVDDDDHVVLTSQMILKKFSARKLLLGYWAFVSSDALPVI